MVETVVPTSKSIELQDIAIRIQPGHALQTSEATGFWLACHDVNAWLRAMLAAQSVCQGEVDFYTLPPEKTSQPIETLGSGGLIGLPRANFPLHRGVMATALHPMQIPLSNGHELKRFTSLWLASTSELSPTLPSHWLGDTLGSVSSSNTCFVWLPAIGLVALEPTDRVTVADLLRVPQHSDRSLTGDRKIAAADRWQSPPSVPILPERIAGFQVIGDEQHKSPLDDLAKQFGQRADDLWSEPDDQTTDHNSDSLVKRGTQWTLRKLDDWLASRQKDKPAQADDSHGRPVKPTSRDNQNAGPAARKRGISAFLFEKLARNVQQQRQQQVNKLLDMFKNDPDRALQFAIPLAGDGKFRGLTVPGSQLLSRMPDFSLSGLSGSGPTDVWSMDYQQQQRLRESYLLTANRELAAGRHRRAAYINARLLGDFAAAAGALEQGGFFREASTLYLDKLKRVSDAARCLVMAGLFEQAVELYESLGDHEMVAKTWEKAGRATEARLAYRRAVDSLKSKGRMRDAAMILNDKLAERQAAKELLWAQWPSGREVLACGMTYFEMLAHDCQHDEALASTKSVFDREATSSSVDLAKLLTHLSKTYPAKSVQEYAYDSCRIVAARTIRNLGVDATQNGLRILRDLDDDDLMVKNDCIRYWTSKVQSTPKTLPRPSRRHSSTNSIEKLADFQLPSGRYVAAKVISGFLFAVRSYESGGLRAGIYCPAQRAIGNQNYSAGSSVAEVTGFRGDEIDGISSYRLQGKEHVFLHTGHAGMSTELAHEVTTADSVGWRLSQQIPAALAHCETVLAASHDFWFGMEYTHGSWHLKTCDVNSQNLRYWSRVDAIDAQSDWAQGDDTDTDMMMGNALSQQSSKCLLACLDGEPVVSCGRTLCFGFGGHGKAFKSVSLPGRPLGLAVGPSGTRKRIAVGHHKGLAVVWPSVGGLDLEVACDERPYSQAMWLPGGRLYAVSDNWLTRFHVKNQQVRAQGTAKLRDRAVIALVPLTSSTCGVVYDDGVVEGY